MDVNPYQPSAVSNDAIVTTELRTLSKPIRTVYRLLWAYPLLLVAALYGTWLLAWFALGHPPRPNLDDPKSINVGIAGLRHLTALLILGLPLAISGGFFVTIWAEAARGKRALGIAGHVIALILLWAATIAVLRWDPLQVAYWFWD